MNIYFGETLKELRHKQNLTQEKLADFLGVSFQTISKWERKESYPDITLLPVIADFFKVSVDELLGLNKVRDEEEIKALLEEHDNYTDEKLILKSITALRKKYPNDFRVQLRWMGYLIFYDWDGLEKNTAEIMSIYNHIQNTCTNDAVRICAKRYYIYLMGNLACKENPTVTFEDYEHVIREMPLMRDGRENYFYLYRLHEHPDADKIVMESIEESLFLFYCNSADHYLTSKFSRDYQIEISERTKDFFNYIYNDGNYSRMWRTVMSRCYGLLGFFYFQSGNEEKALHNLRKAAELAIKFDNLPRITTLHSTLFEGKTFDKQTLGTTFVAKSWMKENIENYPLSEEFKEKPEYKEIIGLLS